MTNIFKFRIIEPFQVKTGLGEAMEGIGEELLEEYKKSGDAKK